MCSYVVVCGTKESGGRGIKTKVPTPWTSCCWKRGIRGHMRGRSILICGEDGHVNGGPLVPEMEYYLSVGVLKSFLVSERLMTQNA